MFKHYKDLCDVVSVLVCCQNDKSFLLTKENNGDFWLPCSKVERNCWKATAYKILFEIFGSDPMSQCQPLRMYKIWLPNHDLNCVYHSIYKVSVKGDVKKKVSTNKALGTRHRLQWFNMVELERQRAHTTLRSPELMDFVALAVGDTAKETVQEDTSMLMEVSEDNIIIGPEFGGGAASSSIMSSGYQILQAAGYTKDDQIRVYREFTVQVYPACYMGMQAFTQFMTDIGWQKAQCLNLFRAADVTGRGGLSFTELLLLSAAMEPSTQHTGVVGDVRCRYIFRYFDSNRDTKLEYVEFKELLAAARASRQLPIDALSVARDADAILRQLGLAPSSQLLLADFQRAVAEQRLRGTSTLLRAPRSTAAYLADLHEREFDLTSSPRKTAQPLEAETWQGGGAGAGAAAAGTVGTAGTTSAGSRRGPAARGDYSVAVYSVRLHRQAQNEMLELSQFDGW